MRALRSLPSKPYVSRARPHCNVIPLDRRGQSSLMTFPLLHTNHQRIFSQHQSKHSLKRRQNSLPKELLLARVATQNISLTIWATTLSRDMYILPGKKKQNDKTRFRCIELPVTGNCIVKFENPLKSLFFTIDLRGNETLNKC